MSELEQKVESLRRMSRQQLKDRWRDLFKVAPPAAFTPDLLARGIAWGLQERALGGLSAAARRVLSAGEGGAGAPAKRKTSRRVLRPGNRLRDVQFHRNGDSVTSGLFNHIVPPRKA